MNILGIGPLLAIVGVATGAIVNLLGRIAGISVALPSRWYDWAFWVGIASIVAGVYFWISSVLLVKRAFGSHRLVKRGVYAISRNPMYAGFIVFLIPGLALALNQLLLILVSIAMFVAFKARIGREEQFLAREFGPEFEEYRKSVPQLMPFIRRSNV